MTVTEFADALRSYCGALRGSVTSWGRTLKHNKAVGGVPDSAHTLWKGADVVYDDPVALDVKSPIAARLGLMIIVEGDHDHIQEKR